MRAAFSVLAIASCLALGVSEASAAEPTMRITSPADGTFTNNTGPVIAGTLEPEGVNYCEVTVQIYEGATTVTPIEKLVASPGACSWEVKPAVALDQGSYTVVATETRYWFEGSELEPREATEESAPSHFTVDTSPPAPAIVVPAPGAVYSTSTIPVSGVAGSGTGDLPDVLVQVFAGGEVAGEPIEAVEAASSGGAWSSAVAGLGPGAYTLRAEQSDTAGNVGISPPVTVNVVPPMPPPAPVASFNWLPASPRIGEQVTLASDSVAPVVPITAYAWSLAAGGPFVPGHPTLTTTFTKAGPNTVRLQVTDALGRSSVATETITVSPESASLMQPFPIVRIAGRETRSGVRLTLLTVEAPVSAKVTVRIRGARGRASSTSRIASAGRAGRPSVLLSFPRFARAIPAGSLLEVRVTKAGEIGKLMRLVPHRGKLPTRQDLCLSPGGSARRCPAS